MGIFKACDIRGRYGEDLTEGIAADIGRAVGTLVHRSPVAVGGDGRRSTPALKQALLSGIVAAGKDAVDLGVLPTPTFYHAVERLAPGAGVMVTASHNRAAYNGFKVVFGDEPPSPERLAAIERLVASGDFASGHGSVREEAILRRYADWLVGSALLLDGLHVAVDAGGGCAGLIMPQVLERLGARVDRLHCDPDPDLSERNPNPAAVGALAELGDWVRETEAELGLGFDGDGDRVILVDDMGRTVSGDLAGTALLKLVVPRQAGAGVVYDLKCSSVFPEVAMELGFATHIERSGYAFMRRRMIEEEAIFGCEMSGHLFFGELGGRDDAMYAALGFAAILAGPGAPRLSEVLADLPQRVTTPDLRIPWSQDRAAATIAALAEAHRDWDLSRLDGVRVTFDHGWALARPSVTEPLLTLRFEADSESHLEQVVRRFLAPLPDLAEAVAAARDESGRC